MTQGPPEIALPPVTSSNLRMRSQQAAKGIVSVALRESEVLPSSTSRSAPELWDTAAPPAASSASAVLKKRKLSELAEEIRQKQSQEQPAEQPKPAPKPAPVRESRTTQAPAIVTGNGSGSRMAAAILRNLKRDR